MAFWDFVKDTGKSVFGGAAEAAEAPKPEAAPAKSAVEQRADALRAEVKRLGLDGNDVQLTLRDDVVKIVSKGADRATMEKLILAVGNIKGISRVEADLPEDAPAPVFYTVKSGDTLSKIAKETLGDANRYCEIFEANKPMLSDPDKIYPGQSLRIPQDK